VEERPSHQESPKTSSVKTSSVVFSGIALFHQGGSQEDETEAYQLDRGQGFYLEAENSEVIGQARTQQLARHGA